MPTSTSWWSRPTASTLAQSGLHYELLKVETSYQWYRQNGQWQYEPIKRTERVADGTLDVAADKPARHFAAGEVGPLSAGSVDAEPNGAVTSLTFDAGFYAEASADTPDLLEVALDKTDYKSGDTMNVAVTARTAGRLTLNVFTDRLVASTSQDVKAGSVQRAAHRRQATGAPAPMWLPPCAVRSMRRRNACPAAPSACSGSRSTATARTLALALTLPRRCGRIPRSACRSSSRALPPARRRAWSSPPSMSAFSI